MPVVHNTKPRPRVVAVGQIPPPMNGYSYITNRMIENLAKNADVEMIDISPGSRRGIRKHLHKIKQTLWSCWRYAKHSDRPALAYLGCEGNWGLIYTAALVATARALGYTIALHHHSFSYIDRRSQLMQFILHAGGSRLQHVFLCTRMRDRFENRYGTVKKSHVVSNAAFVDLPSISNDRPKSECLHLGLLSNLTREKGLYTFLDLLRSLVRAGVNVRGVLAGPIVDEKDKLEVTAAQADLPGVLEYIGPVYGEAKDRFYREIDVFVFPTQYANEAQPTVLFEALAAGNRVIAYDRGCIANQIERNNGLAIPVSEDFCSYASEYINRLICDRSIGESYRREISQQFQNTKALALASAANLLQ